MQLFYTCTGILRILNRLLKVRQYKYFNLYLLKTVSLFTCHSLFHILSTIFNRYLEIWKILKLDPPLVPSFPDKWLSTYICANRCIYLDIIFWNNYNFMSKYIHKNTLIYIYICILRYLYKPIYPWIRTHILHIVWHKAWFILLKGQHGVIQWCADLESSSYLNSSAALQHHIWLMLTSMV